MDIAQTRKPNRAKNPRVLSGVGLTQPALNRLYQFHKYFIDGVRNGRRLVLRSCDLRKLDFSDMDLSNSELISCDFGNATLFRTNFRLAQLFAANFRDADLRGANFEKANLRAAAFEGADLTGAKLEGADLRECAIMDDKTDQVGHDLVWRYRSVLLGKPCVERITDDIRHSYPVATCDPGNALAGFVVNSQRNRCSHGTGSSANKPTVIRYV